MSKAISENNNEQWLEGAEEEIRFALSDSNELVHIFDSILQHYLDEIAELKRKIKQLRKESDGL